MCTSVIFGVYDFDESGFLTIDETILAMRATIGGLCKLANINCPLEAEIENIATSVRVDCGGSSGSGVNGGD